MSRKNLKRIILGVSLALIVLILHLSGAMDYLTLENVQRHGGRLTRYVRGNYAPSVVAYILLFIAVTGLSLPGAAVLGLTGGFLYGMLPAAAYALVGATGGGIVAFLLTRYVLGSWLQQRYGRRLQRLNHEIEQNGAGYLLTVRLAFLPFWLLNIAAAMTTVRLVTFLWTTFLGIIPSTLIYAYIGQQLRRIRGLGDLLTPQVIVPAVLLLAVAFLPTLWNRHHTRNHGH